MLFLTIFLVFCLVLFLCVYFDLFYLLSLLLFLSLSTADMKRLTSLLKLLEVLYKVILNCTLVDDDGVADEYSEQLTNNERELDR